MNNTQKPWQSTKATPAKQQKLEKIGAHEFAKFILVVLILNFGLIRPFIVEAYRIPSGSMEDTLLIGDQILVSKFIYGVKVPGTDIKIFDFHKPARGDVFVFIPPHDDRHFIKRIVAIEGDTVETRDDTLYVNGKTVDDASYTKHLPFHQFRRDFPPFRQREYIPTGENFEDYTLTDSQFRRKFPQGNPFTVPKGMVFAMGDNRDQSSDSRFWGPVSVDDIKGQAFIIVFSVANRPVKLWEVWKMIGNIRFTRIGKLISSEPDSFSQ
ncbi:signal peptidase I [Candidatus Poribacteria bacterium]|nr:signal peptidase I [Candidatus Poribacteria bacterium]MYC77204.1 signal peptidase I [Candidatus Poribacteria bacterium]